MRKIKEILRLHHEMGLSRRRIAESLQIAHSTVGDVPRRAEGAGLGWPIPDNMTWDDVEQLLYPGNTGKHGARPMPEWEQVHRELKRKKSVTLQRIQAGKPRWDPVQAILRPLSRMGTQA